MGSFQPNHQMPSDPSPTLQDYRGYDHVTFYVGNAKQAASFYVARLGFRVEAYRGLETGSSAVSGYVVSNGKARLLLLSPIRSVLALDHSFSLEDRGLAAEISLHVEKHGDSVKDIAFEVNNAPAIHNSAIARGAKAVQGPHAEVDSYGSVVTATVRTYGDVTHTFVQRNNYSGVFLPGYQALTVDDPISRLLPSIKLLDIDHCVGNQDWGGMQDAADFYEQVLGFSRYWTIDDKSMCTEFSAMRSIVVSSPSGNVKFPINEPARGKKTSQVEEFVQFNGGPGVQHIAFRTDDILTTVSNLRKRGLEFIKVPHGYYEDLQLRLKSSGTEVQQDLEALRRQSILVDFDEHGYLLQIFTKPLLDRPTIFLEIIQRENFAGFGTGNFKALFEAVEREQARRGTL